MPQQPPRKPRKPAAPKNPVQPPAKKPVESKSKFSSDEMKRYFFDRRYREEMLARSKNFFRKYRTAFIITGIVLIIGLFFYLRFILSGLPSLEQLENPKPELATKVYSIDGEVLDQFYLKNRTYIGLENIPKPVIDALIATEDKDFYHHWGVSLWRVPRAILRGQGASTITMQLSRNLYNFQSIKENAFDKMSRKIREFITAVQIERTYTKKEILEMYLNWIYLGRSAYGISAAASIYFDKSATQLNLAEGSLLIGMAKGPAYYDPFRHPERAFSRRDVVLSQMIKYGKITSQEADDARKDSLQFNTSDSHTLTGIAPHYVEFIRQQLLQKSEQYNFDIFKDGLTVYTSLDSRMQKYANKAVEEHLAEQQAAFNGTWDWNQHRDVLVQAIDKSIKETTAYKKAATKEQRDSITQVLGSDRSFADSVQKVAHTIEVGLIVLDPRTGGIRAMVGGANFRSFKYGLNHTTQIQRQPGSAFKPFVYTVAIDNGYAPSYELLNQPVTLVMEDGTRWTPENSDGTVGGKYTLREGLRESINLIAIRAIMEIAPKNLVVDYAHRMGITTRIPSYESIALGTATVIPLDMAAAFGVFANEGVYVKPTSIIRIEDKDGNLIEENMPERNEVLSKETAYIMTSMLEDVVNKGTGLRVRNFFHYPAAGKTGTTQDFADAWFVGYTPQLSAAVWIGFDDQRVRFTNWDGQGGRAAAPLWGRFMQYVYADQSIPLAADYFIQPETVVTDTICTDTKKLATEFCPRKTTELFNVKNQPLPCDKHTATWHSEEQEPSKIRF